jgi:hypothetical protein
MEPLQTNNTILRPPTKITGPLPLLRTRRERGDSGASGFLCLFFPFVFLFGVFAGGSDAVDVHLLLFLLVGLHELEALVLLLLSALCRGEEALGEGHLQGGQEVAQSR